jgi:hypothetical protein
MVSPTMSFGTSTRLRRAEMHKLSGFNALRLQVRPLMLDGWTPAIRWIASKVTRHRKRRYTYISAVFCGLPSVEFACLNHVFHIPVHIATTAATYVWAPTGFRTVRTVATNPAPVALWSFLRMPLHLFSCRREEACYKREGLVLGSGYNRVWLRRCGAHVVRDLSAEAIAGSREAVSWELIGLTCLGCCM